MRRLIAQGLVALLALGPFCSSVAAAQQQPPPTTEKPTGASATGNTQQTAAASAPATGGNPKSGNVSSLPTTPATPAVNGNGTPPAPEEITLVIKGEGGTPRHRLKPFTKMPVTQKRIAQALRECDRSILNVDCEEFVRRLNQRHKLGLFMPDMDQARRDAAHWLENVTVPVRLQATGGFFDAAMPDGKIAVNGVQRNSLPNEPGLGDPNTGLAVISLNCGNTAADGVEAVFTPEEPGNPGGGSGSNTGSNANRNARSWDDDARRNGRGSRDEDGDGMSKGKMVAIGAGVAAGVALALSFLRVKNTNIQNNGVR
jgi:hypothetical protein